MTAIPVPWVPGISDAERLARYRGLRALVQLLAGPGHPLVLALARAEADPSNEAAALAWKPERPCRTFSAAACWHPPPHR